ncbi:hypothetical protein ABT147_36695 [Streptomyces sp. NPDC001868]|uniref:hypothetical protein n=1 Tax=Streptomyces sp. NPDC001868 TaxID=3154401 RepID=UPI0033262601
MASFIVFALVLAPFLAPLVFAAVTVNRTVRAHDRRTGGERRHLPDTGTCALVAVIGGVTALGAYAGGVLSGFYLLDPEQLCTASGAPGRYVVTQLTLPLSVRCVTEEGTGTELVPGWVNPVVFTGATLCALALGTAITRALRASRARPETSRHPSDTSPA